MSVSTRLSIHWPESEGPTVPAEKTNTLVLSSPSGIFTDVRSLKQFSGQFPFEWAFAGYENVLGTDPETNLLKIEFNHQFFDNYFILDLFKHIKNPKKYPKMPVREDIPDDVGFFETLPSGLRKEVGSMMNPGTGKVEPYVEIWMSLDLALSTPDKFVMLDDNATVPVGVVDSFVWDVAKDGMFEGRMVKVGNWVQGLVWNKKDLVHDEHPKISVIRYFGSGTGVTDYKKLIDFGADVNKFVLGDALIGNVGDKVTIGSVSWTCVEAVADIYKKERLSKL